MLLADANPYKDNSEISSGISGKKVWTTDMLLGS